MLINPAPYKPGPGLQDGGQLNVEAANPGYSIEVSIGGTGNSQKTAYQLTATISLIESGGDGTGVRLPVAKPGWCPTIINRSGSSKIVYPAGTNPIDGSSSVTLQDGQQIMLLGLDDEWISGGGGGGPTPTSIPITFTQSPGQMLAAVMPADPSNDDWIFFAENELDIVGDTGGAWVYSKDNATGVGTGSCGLYSGAETDVGSDTPTGNVFVLTGAHSGTGNSGDMQINTGQTNGGTSGSLLMYTGASAELTSGNITVTSGNAAGNTGNTFWSSGGSFSGTSGNTTVQTGGGASSGVLQLATGGTSNGASGYAAMFTGNASGGDTGYCLLRTGDSATNNSGDITLQTGTASGTRGTINIAGDMRLTDGNGQIYSGLAIGLDIECLDGTGGVIYMQSSNGAPTADGAAFVIQAGNGGETSGNGANLQLFPGSSTVGNGGSTQLFGGTSANGNGGGVSLTGGNGTESGHNGGDVYIQPGFGVSGSGSGHLVLNNIPTADPHLVGAVWNSSGVLHISAG